MAQLTDQMLGAMNEKTKQTNKPQKEIKSETETQNRAEKNQKLSSEPTSFEDFRLRWNKRSVTKQPHPYVNHIELFLGLISSEYNAELQTSLAEINLNGPTKEQKKGFIAQNSKVKFNWQVLDDRCEIIDGAKVSNPFAIKGLYGPLQPHFKALYTRNIRGANPCIAINELVGAARTNVGVVRARAIWIEDDEVRTKPRSATDNDNPLPLPPSFIVESSKGKYHYYWLTITEDLKTWERIQKQVMTERFESDPGANGLNRAMRIPGFWHSKKRGFPTRIVYMLGKDNYPIIAEASKEFKEFAKDHQGVYEQYAFEPGLANAVKRYDWEEILEAFGKFLPEEPLTNEYSLSEFDPIQAMDAIFASDDFHGSLHSLCMHFANYNQDPEYITYIVQSLMCRVPEAQRDMRWTTRFNDVGRSAQRVAVKKLQELAQETLLPNEVKEQKDISIQEVGIHDEDWHMEFPDITGITPIDNLMEAFGSGTGHPIRSFNFTAVFSFFSLCLQNKSGDASPVG